MFRVVCMREKQVPKCVLCALAGVDNVSPYIRDIVMPAPVFRGNEASDLTGAAAAGPAFTSLVSQSHLFLCCLFPFFFSSRLSLRSLAMRPCPLLVCVSASPRALL